MNYLINTFCIKMQHIFKDFQSGTKSRLNRHNAGSISYFEHCSTTFVWNRIFITSTHQAHRVGGETGEIVAILLFFTYRKKTGGRSKTKREKQRGSLKCATAQTSSWRCQLRPHKCRGWRLCVHELQEGTNRSARISCRHESVAATSQPERKEICVHMATKL